MKKRLANTRTRSETGLDYVIQNINLSTPFGKKMMKEAKPFSPGEEQLLEEEFQRLSTLFSLVEQDLESCDAFLQTLMEVKDVRFTIQRSGNNALSSVEIFEVKSLLLKMRRIGEIFNQTKVKLPDEYKPEDTEQLLSILDPRRDRMETFYIYDEFSEILSNLRKSKRALELDIRKEQKQQKEIIKNKYGIDLTPKFDYAISKASSEHIKMVREIPELIQDDEDYVSVTFVLKNTEQVEILIKEMETLNQKIDEEELKIRETLSKEIAQYTKILLENCTRIGKLDIALSKSIYAKEHNCVRPTIVQEHVIEIEDGRHLQVEDNLHMKKKQYCPVSIALSDGVTCITGANMGGKTVCLKLVGLVSILAQYGFFVPCKSATVGLSNYMQILIGDNQSVERGLSSFGSEMEILKEILDNGTERSLLLIDEIASGTNPIEGFALTKSIVDYLKQRPYISLITTHYDSVTTDGDVRNMQVVGLANADFRKLDKEIRYANRKERLNIISKYMDYRLYQMSSEKTIPKDALNIAKILGINSEIIENAKRYILNNELKGGKG